MNICCIFFAKMQKQIGADLLPKAFAGFKHFICWQIIMLITIRDNLERNPCLLRSLSFHTEGLFVFPDFFEA